MLPRLILALALALALGASPAGPAAIGRPGHFLVGRMLVAQPQLGDPNFRRTVVFLASHDEKGAFGLVVNRMLGSKRYAILLEALGREALGGDAEIRVHAGGPVQPDRLFLLHSRRDGDSPMIAVNERYGVSAGAEPLEVLARGEGPERVLLMLGYAGWAPGQLEQELARGDWAIAPADEAILFDGDYPTKWRRALERQLVPT